MTEATPESHKMSIPIAIKSILTSYITLTALLYGTQNNRSLRDVEELIRELLPLTDVKISENRLCLLTEINMNLIPESDIYQRSHGLNNPRPTGTVFFPEPDESND